jgi:serine/threonine protein kinase
MTTAHHPCLQCQAKLAPELLSCPYCGFKIGSGEHAEAWLEETIDSKYRIDEILGVGGMGMVFKATRILLGDQVALKILFPHLLNHPLQKRLFEDEAIATAQLSHPNVITIYDAYIDPEYQIAYMAMELLDGISFKEVMREKAPMNQIDLYDPIIQMCDGLYAAHSLGLVHRDLKPDNIFVTQNPDGSPLYKILDFGIATLAGEINADEENKLLGTLRYMAPEQCLSEKVTAQTDIYALGIILYEALTRQRAVGKTVDSVLYDAIAPLKQRVPQIDPQFEALVESMIAKRAEQRPKSVIDVKKAIIAIKNKSKSSAQLPKINTPAPLPVQNTPIQTKNITPPVFKPNPQLTPLHPNHTSFLNSDPSIPQIPPNPNPNMMYQQPMPFQQPQPYAQPIPVIVPMNYQASKTFGWDEANYASLGQQEINAQAEPEIESHTEQFEAPQEKGFFTFSKMLILCMIAMILVILLKKFN